MDNNATSTNEAISSVALAIKEAFGNGAVTLGFVERTSTFTAASTALQDITTLSITVVVPNGGRRVEIEFFSPQIYCSIDANRVDIVIEEDGVEIAASYDRTWTAANGGNGGRTVRANKRPTAGSHTYKARIRTGIGAGLGSVFASSTAPAYLTAKMV